MPPDRSPGGAVFVQPSLVCQVAFQEWTRAGVLRQPNWQGLHESVDPNSVARKTVTDADADAE